jgi:3-oxoacyl-[acyl-carrier protein] reductase
LAIKADVSQRNQVTDLFDKTIETFGKLNVLTNNAGIIYNAFLKDNTQEGFIKLFDVNVKGIFNTLQEANNLSSM